ncbi:Bug family tripartite tricarboxylate transporter substrate binding protein [Humitalea sp. 24SJ18S-53]|uniref:Bug family tripartite tricarboxylate transporter substrate binding protein n=1 Tax=Humitalea sp. 24SJ18S-53 TaxID=3422307 RepID=UPI003D67D3E6
MPLPRRQALGLVALPALLLHRGAAAQAWPSRPIRLISGSSPGSITDLIARIVQPGLGERLGQPMIVDNRPGAGGNIATGFVAQAPADGYTLMVLSGGIMTLNQYLYRDMPFDPVRDIKLITRLTNGGFLLTVSTASGITDVAGLLARLRQKGDAANYGTPGVGFAQHVGSEMFLSATGVTATHVPYRGSAAAVQGLIAGEVDFIFDSRGPLVAQLQAGTLRLIANGGSVPDPVYPALPTLSDTWPDVVVQSWTALAGPSALPAPIVQRLDDATRATLLDPEVTARLRMVGNGPAYLGPDDFIGFYAAERARAARSVAIARIVAQ